MSVNNNKLSHAVHISWLFDLSVLYISLVCFNLKMTIFAPENVFYLLGEPVNWQELIMMTSFSLCLMSTLADIEPTLGDCALLAGKAFSANML